MIKFDKEYFQKYEFSPEQILRYFKNAVRDLEIAQKDKFTEVKFTYLYQSLIKAGIALIAYQGGVKARSVPGHHIKILSALSRLLNKPDILVIGNAMRMKRNQDLYDGGEFISEKEVADYFEFVARVVKKVEKIIR